MESPCNNCPERQLYARMFDMHFSGADCPYECEEYERYLRSSKEDAYEMSFQYDDYLKGHISAVQKAADWIVLHCQDMIPKVDEYKLRCHISMHDNSKLSPEEYDAYDAYFYSGNKSHKVVADFNYAWLHHIHCNPHHWQYWILVHDDEPEEILEMPLEYVIEMIADWWSFSFRSGNLREIFGWYDEHKEMKLHPKTRKVVEDILARIKVELDKEEAIQGRL